MSNLSICIPTYNRLGLLKKLVNGIPEKYHVYISDNGNYVPDNCFSRTNIVIDHKPIVIPPDQNWNNATRLTKEDWFILPGDDDIIIPSKLNIIEDYIEKYSDCGLILFGYDIIDENDDVRAGWCPEEEIFFNPPESFYFLKRSLPCRWPAIVINTKRCRGIGGFADKRGFVCTAEDCLFLQHMAIKFPIALVPHVVGQYRIWGGNGTSTSTFSEQWFKDINLWQDVLKEILENENLYEVDCDKLRDQVIGDNLLSALYIAKDKSIGEKYRFVKNVGWPHRADFIDKLRLIKNIVL